MNRKIVSILCIGFIVIYSTSLVACSKKSSWSFSKEEKTFSGESSKINIKKGEKIPLSTGDFAIRVYYEITNLEPKSENAYTLLLNETNGIYQNKKELKSTTILFADDSDAEKAVNVEVESGKTVEVYVDYDLLNYESDIEIKFTEDIGEETRAILPLKIDYFEDIVIN